LVGSGTVDPTSAAGIMLETVAEFRRFAEDASARKKPKDAVEGLHISVGGFGQLFNRPRFVAEQVGNA
jgi:hypothetical protein